MYNNLKKLKIIWFKDDISRGKIEISKYFMRRKVATSTLLNN